MTSDDVIRLLSSQGGAGAPVLSLAEEPSTLSSVAEVRSALSASMGDLGLSSVATDVGRGSQGRATSPTEPGSPPLNAMPSSSSLSYVAEGRSALSSSMGDLGLFLTTLSRPDLKLSLFSSVSDLV